MRPTPEATRAARREIAAVAAAMAAGATGLAEGCRRVMMLRDGVSKPDFDDADLVRLAVVGYELDDVPLGPVREHWAAEALLAVDARVAAYLTPRMEELLLACQRLGARWGVSVESMTRTLAARRAIAYVAARMAACEIGVLQGCRQVVDLRGNLMEPDLSDDDLLWMVVIESELDDVPLGSARERWDPAALAEKERRVEAYLERVMEEFVLACRRLSARSGEAT